MVLPHNTSDRSEPRGHKRVHLSGNTEGCQGADKILNVKSQVVIEPDLKTERILED